MRAIAFVLACLTAAAYGRRVHVQKPETAEQDASTKLATLLQAFNTAPVAPRTSAPSRSTSVRMAETKEKKAATKAGKDSDEPEVLYSESLPFLTRRASLGPVGEYVGDVGFDPLGFTEVFDIRWLREAEIKHCRVAMLAFVGFAFTDFYHLPGFDYTTVDAHDAAVASGAMSQLLLWIGILEFIGLISIDQTMRGSGRDPGDFGFDPLGFSTDPDKKKELQMKELANGRLAMFAFGGAVTQAVLTGNTFPWLYGSETTVGSGGDFAWNIVP